METIDEILPHSMFCDDWHEPNNPKDPYDCTDCNREKKIKQAIKNFVEQESVKARIDELAMLIFNDDEFATLEEIKNGKSVGGGMIQTELVEDRIKELGE